VSGREYVQASLKFRETAERTVVYGSWAYRLEQLSYHQIPVSIATLFETSLEIDAEGKLNTLNRQNRPNRQPFASAQHLRD